MIPDAFVAIDRQRDSRAFQGVSWLMGSGRRKNTDPAFHSAAPAGTPETRAGKIRDWQPHCQADNPNKRRPGKRESEAVGLHDQAIHTKGKISNTSPTQNRTNLVPGISRKKLAGKNR